MSMAHLLLVALLSILTVVAVCLTLVQSLTVFANLISEISPLLATSTSTAVLPSG